MLRVRSWVRLGVFFSGEMWYYDCMIVNTATIPYIAKLDRRSVKSDVSEDVDATTWSDERLVSELQNAVDYSEFEGAVFYTPEESRALLHKEQQWTTESARSF